MALFDQYTRDLFEAVRLVKRGDPVPVDVAMRLAAEGYDIENLEKIVTEQLPKED